MNEAILKQLELLQLQLQAAQAQVHALATMLRMTPDVPVHPAQAGRPLRDPDALRATDQSLKPSSELLAQCPRCGSATEWRWSRANGEWFAGCVTFRDAGCKGTHSYDKLSRAAEGRTEQLLKKAEVLAEDEEAQQRRQDEDGSMTARDGEPPF